MRLKSHVFLIALVLLAVETGTQQRSFDVEIGSRVIPIPRGICTVRNPTKAFIHDVRFEVF